MRIFSLIFGCLLFYSRMCAQSFELPAKSLIEENRVKIIKCTSYCEPNDSNTVSYLDVWKYDSIGRIYFHQLIDKDTSEGGDTTFCGDYYFYNKNGLVESWNIGVWNVRTMKVDTAVTKYYYNKQDSLVRETYKNPALDDDHSVLYTYMNGHRVKEIYKDTLTNSERVVDSLVYSPDGKLNFEFKGWEKGIKYEYNNYQQLSRITEYYGWDTSWTERITSFYYNTGQLSMDIENDSDLSPKRKKGFYCRRGVKYVYYKNRLLREIRRLDDNAILDRYEYEYY